MSEVVVVVVVDVVTAVADFIFIHQKVQKERESIGRTTGNYTVVAVLLECKDAEIILNFSTDNYALRLFFCVLVLFLVRKG